METIADDLYCELYVDGPDWDQLMRLLSRDAEWTREGTDLRNSVAWASVLRNENHVDGSDDFVEYHFRIEIEPVAPVRFQLFVGTIRSMMERLATNGWRAQLVAPPSVESRLGEAFR